MPGWRDHGSSHPPPIILAQPSLQKTTISLILFAFPLSLTDTTLSQVTRPAHPTCTPAVMKSISLTETLLPQPPSFHKKKCYEIHQVLGTGTFGKVMVCKHVYARVAYCLHGRVWPFHSVQHGTSRLVKSQSLNVVLLQQIPLPCRL